MFLVYSYISISVSIRCSFLIILETLKIDEQEFKALFQSKEQIKHRTLIKDNVTDNAVKVIDPKRANNGGITLARLKMSYDDIALAIYSM